MVTNEHVSEGSTDCGIGASVTVRFTAAEWASVRAYAAAHELSGFSELIKHAVAAYLAEAQPSPELSVMIDSNVLQRSGTRAAYAAVRLRSI